MSSPLDPSDAFVPPAGRPPRRRPSESRTTGPRPPAVPWRIARRGWLSERKPPIDPDEAEATERPIGVGAIQVERLPAAVQLLPEVHRQGEVAGLHVARVDGREAIVFEHSWTVGLVQTVLQVRSVVAAAETGPWPRVRIRPRRGLFRRPGRGELLVEHDPFVRRFSVRTDDEDFAILLLTPELQAWLAEGPRATWEVGPGCLAMIRPGRLREADDDVEAALHGLETFLHHVPDELAYWGT